MTVFHPCYRFYQDKKLTVSFPQFYQDWTRRYYRTLCSGRGDFTRNDLEACLSEFVKRRRFRMKGFATKVSHISRQVIDVTLGSLQRQFIFFYQEGKHDF